MARRRSHKSHSHSRRKSGGRRRSSRRMHGGFGFSDSEKQWMNTKGAQARQGLSNTWGSLKRSASSSLANAKQGFRLPQVLLRP